MYDGSSWVRFKGWGGSSGGGAGERDKCVLLKMKQMD